MVLVDDADILAVWEPEEAEVFRFLQMAVQVVKNLASAEGKKEKSCLLQGDASVPPHQKQILKIVLTLPNGKECILQYAGPWNGPLTC